MVACDNTIFVADKSNGIQMSTDNGSTWIDVSEGNLFAKLGSNDGGVIISEDNGSN